VTDAPLVAGSLYGLRFWRVIADAGDEFLAGPITGACWPTGGEWMRAACATGHDAPAPDCDCGVHAWHPRRESARSVMRVRGMVPGVMEAQGPVEVHEDGFRAERGRPHALVATRGGNRRLIARLAERYGAEVIDADGPDALLAWCRERQLGMDEPVVAELLGIGDLDERRRAKLRQARTDALRVAVAVVVSLLLVALGLVVATDPPGERTLYGRTGEVHTH
jgi:hypothetical protein